MIGIFEFPNAKAILADIKNINRELQKNLNDHTYMKVKKTVIHCKLQPVPERCSVRNLARNQPATARVPRQKNTRARKMNSPQPGCYDHVMGEI